MKKPVYIICIIALCLCVLAGCNQKAGEPTVVTLVYDGSATEVRTSQWDEKSVQISTEDLGLGKKKACDYVGVKLSDLMDMADAEDCAKAVVSSSDGYSKEIPAEDIKNYDIALVNGYAGGGAILSDAGGPVKLVFPVSDHPELKDTYDQWSWLWYVDRVEFVK